MAVLSDPETAPINEKVRATLRFLAKMTRSPDELGPEDVDAVLAAGVSEAALDDAIHVCAAFNVIVRLADAFEFKVPPWEEQVRAAQGMVKRGYQM